MQRHDAEDKDQRQHQDDNRINLEARRLVGVEAKHSAARAASARGARAAGPGIGDLLLLVGGSATTDRSASTTGRGRRRRANGRGARRGANW